MFKTRMTELLGVKYPIQCGTMMHLSDAKLVAACANAGIFACLASAMYPDEKSLVDELKKIKSMTDQPFGVNVSLFPGSDARTVDVTLDILARENVGIIETAGRSPESHLEKIRQSNPIHLHKCARLRDALKVEKLGVDMVTVVGSECGGHPGMEDISTMVLIPEVASQVSIPLLAGGGFCDGKGLIAALAMGADGVVIGSRFLNVTECKVSDKIKQEMIDAKMTDTMVIQKSIKSPIRVLDNAWAREILEMEANGATLEELLPKLSGQLSGEAWTSGGEKAIFPCGQVIGRIKENLSVQELVDQIIVEATNTEARLHSLTS